jgi:acyl carrier protein
MKQEEKIAMLEDMLELESGSLKPEMELNEISEYDSMAKLSLIVMMDEEFNKKLTGEQIQKFHAIKDVLDFMES